MISLYNSFKLMIRNVRVNMDPGTLIFLLAMPSMYLIFMGYMFNSIVSGISVGASSVDYRSFISPGIVAFETLTAGAVAGSLLWSDRRYGMFEQILSLPYTRSEYLLGIIFTTIVFAVFGAGIMLVVSLFVVHFQYISIMGWLTIFGNVILGSLFWGLVLLSLAAVVRSNQMYNSIQIIILFFANFASTVFYPITSSTPVSLRDLFYINPLTYTSNAIRSGYYSTMTAGVVLQQAVLVVETVFIFVVALLVYRKVRVGVV